MRLYLCKQATCWPSPSRWRFFGCGDSAVLDESNAVVGDCADVGSDKDSENLPLTAADTSRRVEGGAGHPGFLTKESQSVKFTGTNQLSYTYLSGLAQTVCMGSVKSKHLYNTGASTASLDIFFLILIILFGCRIDKSCQSGISSSFLGLSFKMPPIKVLAPLYPKPDRVGCEGRLFTPFTTDKPPLTRTKTDKRVYRSKIA